MADPVILAVNETAISNSFQQLLSEGDGVMSLSGADSGQSSDGP